ncbi:GNAT family N-acetyltransferase [Plantactinospora sp. GCM10030261]|uniref:GNAT family N-acetyltransferase n=1 Tax=Plantactinospora sp. GCM10030261 TaxID=3273420 RepID=UPI00361F76DF
MYDRRLYLHLATWLGQWPAGPGLHVVGSVRRTTPGWDGQVYAMVGVGGGGSTVISIPPDRAVAARMAAAGSLGRLLARLPAVLHRPDSRTYRAVFRTTRSPARLPPAGEWVPAGDPVVPDWLRPFGGEVLLARDVDGGYLAGVGIKRHDRHGHELAVGTEPAARGRGLARRLVAQAARRVLDEGAIPTYLHAVDNVASARVARAAGFPDRGWSAYGMVDPPQAG